MQNYQTVRVRNHFVSKYLEVIAVVSIYLFPKVVVFHSVELMDRMNCPSESTY